jgi:hypothetical protein
MTVRAATVRTMRALLPAPLSFDTAAPTLFLDKQVKFRFTESSLNLDSRQQSFAAFQKSI